MTPQPTLDNVNLQDPRQDVQRKRLVRPSLNRFRVAERLLPARAGQGLKVLEVGGGAAEFSIRLRELGHQVTFVDLSETNVHRASMLGFEAYRLDLNTGLTGLENGSFEVVVMLEIIEHIVAAEHLLAEARRVLVACGHLILSTPNFAYWPNRLRVLVGRLSCDEGYHYRFFTPSVLDERLRKAGFTVERSAHTAPATGLNFFWNRLAGRSRLHFHVPRLLAALLAHTLLVRACAR